MSLAGARSFANHYFLLSITLSQQLLSAQLHLVILGGAISEENERWLASRKDLFVHTKPLAVMFRAKLL